MVPRSPGTGSTRSTTGGRSTSTRRSWRSCWRGSAPTDRCRPRTWSHARPSTGTGGPRTRSGRCSRRSREAGILGIARREGNRRVYDLAERLFPAELLAERRPEREQRRHKLLSRYRGNGLLGATGDYSIWAGTGEAADAGLAPRRAGGRRERSSRWRSRGSRARGSWWADERADARRRRGGGGRRAGADGRGRASRSSRPLDPLAWDRDLLLRLWGFDYRWEVYVPAAKRRWGYYVLPLLYGDRFVGRIEPRIDRKTGTLRILGLWWEDGFDPLSAANPGFVDAFTDAHPGAHGLRGPAQGGDAAGRAAPGARGGGPGEALRLQGSRAAGPGSEAASPARVNPPCVRPIMPAATVLLLASSTRMNEPVCAVLLVGVHEQRLGRRAAAPGRSR